MARDDQTQSWRVRCPRSPQMRHYPDQVDVSEVRADALRDGAPDAVLEEDVVPVGGQVDLVHEELDCLLGQNAAGFVQNS